MSSSYVDGPFLQLASWILSIQNGDGSLPASRPGDHNCGEWTTASMLSATLVCEDLACALYTSNAPVAKAIEYLNSRTIENGWLPMVPGAPGAVEPTAAFIELLARAETVLGLSNRAQLFELTQSVLSASLEGCWAFHVDEKEESVISTCMVLRALREVRKHSVDSTIESEIAAGIRSTEEWLKERASSLDVPADIAQILLNVRDRLSSDVRATLATRLLRAVDESGGWPQKLERHGFMSVIRYTTPYAVGALAHETEVDKVYLTRAVDWLLEEAKWGGARLTPDADLTTWPSRDVLYGLAEVRAAEIGCTRSLLQVYGESTLAAEDVAARNWLTTMRPNPERSWAKRYSQDCRILHLSDLHFGEYQRDRDIPLTADLLYRDLLRSGSLPIDLVAVTGDLTSGIARDRAEHPLEFQEAVAFLEDLGYVLGVPKQKFVVVPGNHDVVWFSELPESRTQINRNAINYQNFYATFYGTQAPASLMAYCYDSQSRILVVGLNSCVDEKTPETGWIGRVGGKQLDDLSELVNRLEADEGRIIKVAAMHHHLVPVAFLERVADPVSAVSLTIDAEAVTRRLLQLGFDLVLHGHQHQPFTALEKRLYLAGQGAQEVELSQSLIVHGAGSLGAPQRELGTIARNSYSILTIRNHGIDLCVRESHPEEMGSFQTYLEQRIPIL